MNGYAFLAVILLGITGFILFANLGRDPLIDYDEAIYAQVAKEALHNHQQADLTWLGNTSLGRAAGWFEKPPLMLWLTELSFKTFGATEFAARLWVALFALATVILACWLVWLELGSARAAALTAAAFLVSYQFLQLGSVLQMDVPVGFFILLAVFAFVRGRQQQNYYYLLGAALGLAVMTKSIVGLLPLPIIFVYAVVQADWQWLRTKQFYYGLLIALAIVIPWHALETMRHGKAFWNSYLWYHIFTRYEQALELHISDHWFFWNIIKAQRVLFTGAALGFFYFLWKTVRRIPAYSLILIAAVFIFLFFSSSKTRLAAYIVIIYPFLAIMFGAAVDRVIKALKIKTLQIIAVLLIAAGCAYLGIRYNNYNQGAKAQQRDIDNKNIGLFLKDNFTAVPAYCKCTAGTSPAVIFYSGRAFFAQGLAGVPTADRYVVVSEDKNAPPLGELILDTPTKAVYYVNP